jgi:Chlamydia major outer membrane protein
MIGNNGYRHQINFPGFFYLVAENIPTDKDLILRKTPHILPYKAAEAGRMIRSFHPLFCLLFATLILEAAPVGNTMAPQLIQEGFLIPSDFWIDLRVGYEGDFVGDGKLKQTEEGSGRVDTFQQYTNGASITLNFLDRLDLFTILGSSRASSNWRINYSGTITQIQLETLYHFLWGIGGRGIFCEWKNVCLGLGGRYAQCEYRPSWLTTNAVPVSVSGTYLFWREWQINLDVSYHIDIFTPYFGVKYSNVTSKLGVFSTPISNSGLGMDHFENRSPIGIFIGCAISNSEYFMLNIEGRLIDENAITISGELRF